MNAVGVNWRRWGRGRALWLGRQGEVYFGRRYTVYRVADRGRVWERITTVPSGLGRRTASLSRLGTRLLRQEVKAMLRLSDGRYVAATREGVFWADPGQPRMVASEVEVRDLPPSAPMCLGAGPRDLVIWGEYVSRRRPEHGVHIYASSDRGQSFRIVYGVGPREIKHFHNVQFDPGLGRYWVLAGDHGEEPGIGLLSADFREFQWVVRGEQRHRAVEFFDLGDCLVYGTDTEKDINRVMRLDKRTGRLEPVAELDGSCIYACQFGGIYALTTTVEPSTVNHGRHAGLWLSRDGYTWRRVLQAEKDMWHATYFQFGSLVLPRGRSTQETIWFSGQALQGCDGVMFAAELSLPLPD